MPAITFVTESADQTRRLGAALGRLLPAGTVVLLHGDLGAGKTTLTQGIAQGLGIREPIQSPSFTLVAEHEAHTAESAPTRLYHLDLYRLVGEDDLDSFGWDHYLSPTDAITVVEWPERAGRSLPGEYLLIQLDVAGPDQRRVTIEAVPPNGDLTEVMTALHDPRSSGRVRPDDGRSHLGQPELRWPGNATGAGAIAPAPVSTRPKPKRTTPPTP